MRKYEQKFGSRLIKHTFIIDFDKPDDPVKDVTGNTMYSTAKDFGNFVSVYSKEALGGEMISVYQYKHGQLILSATLLDEDKKDSDGKQIELEFQYIDFFS